MASIISGNVPSHLIAAARTGFLATSAPKVPSYERIAATLQMDEVNQTLVDIGGAPMPLRSRGRGQRQQMIEKMLSITPLDWEVWVSVSYNAVKDDQTASLERKARSAGSNFPRHMGKLAFQALNDGDATTNFGAGYDGLSFYNDSHLDKGAAYQTAQDNKNALTLSIDNFETVKVAAAGFKDDQGEETDYDYNLLVVPPALERVAANITGNKETYDTANRELNPYAGSVDFVVSSQLDSTAWVLAASSEQTKPILVVIREQPSLQVAQFNPDGPDGGSYEFKFYGRYNHYYGDWRTAALGNT